MNSRTKLAFAVAALAFSFGAMAQPKAPEPAPVAKPAAAASADKSAERPGPGVRPGPRMGPGPGQAIPDKVTRAEAIKRATDQFDAIDLNKDAVVTKDEIQAFQTKMREAMTSSVGGPAQGAGPSGRPAGAPPRGAPPAGPAK